MKKITINVYKDKKVKKTVEAEMIDLEFGTIRSLMELLNVESIEDTTSLLKTIYAAWGDITNILSDAFPDMKYDDWEHVKVKELLPAIIDILKYSFSEILTIPGDSKNVMKG